MFDSLKRLIGVSSSAGDATAVLASWAKAEGHVFKHVTLKSGEGYVVETPHGWRVEWGPSQRPYIIGKELRFRCETGVPGDVQMVMLTKVLAQTLESDVFNRYTDAMQTQIDATMPDEMRWLAMHARVSLNDSAVLSRRFALLCNAEELAKDWLDGPTVQALEHAASHWWTDALVLVVTLNRGILTARMAGQPLEVAQLQMVGDLFARLADRWRAVAVKL
ncbi:MAG TPA: hypothetical protein VEQ09_01260 [Aquabacterium sp.]|nr:hypothetical protein [Aquabacterium sp.]